MRRRSILASLIVPAVLMLAAIVAPAVVRAGGGCHGTAPTAPGDDEASVVKIDGCMFYPTVARVPIGTTVRFVNSGQVPHNVTGVSGAWGSPGEFAPNAEYKATFSAAGIYPFACTLHPGMNGAIVVGDVGTAAAPAAPGAVTAATEPTAAPAEPATPAATSAATNTPDLAPMAIVGLAGFALGVIGSLLATGAFGLRRRDEAAPTVR